MIYLASKSPRRSELLQDAGIDFKVLATKAEESFDLNQAVSANAERLSILKACLLYTSPSPRDRG